MDIKLQKNLLNGRVSQIKGDAIVSVIHNFPNLSRENVKKLEKAYRSGKGCRIQLMEHEIGGSGFASMAKKGLKSGAKFVKENKQLSALKDQAIDRGLNYAVNKAGLDENTGNLVKGLAKNVVNKQFDSMAGSGFGSMAKKGLKSGAKFVKNNKQLNQLKDQAIDRGLNYAVSQTGLDENTGSLVKGLAKNVVNKQFDNLAGGNVFNKNLGRKILKAGAKALKVGNKISNAMGYDDLQDMGIDIVANETLGRIDPTLGRMAGNAMKKVADKQIDKYAGGAINQYLPTQLRGGSLGILKDYATQPSASYNDYSSSLSTTKNLPMFDVQKMRNYDRRDYIPHSMSRTVNNLPMFDLEKAERRGAGFLVH